MRKNWFAGVLALKALSLPETRLQPKDRRFEPFHAGGLNRQHQNITGSAVWVGHLPSGLMAISRDQRPQYRNKAKALERLEAMLALALVDANAQMRTTLNRLHQNLARGAPTRVFSGLKFKETS